MSVRVGLLGDTMLGRGVAERLREDPSSQLFAPEVVAAASEADLLIANLECCISDRGTPWPDSDKRFFFRAPPSAAASLRDLGVDVVTLANNHALDYGPQALADTIEHLGAAGIGVTGAGGSVEEARRPEVRTIGQVELAVMGLTDHPADYAAGLVIPGVAYGDLRREVPEWLAESVRAGRDAGHVVLVSPHWGPNMAPRPVPHVRRAARALLAAGASLVAGHSAHVFHGVAPRMIYDLGDFVDDYATDPRLRNDLGLLWLVELDRDGPVRIEAVPLRLDYCFTRLADADDRAWITARLRAACAELGTAVEETDADRLRVTWTDGRRQG